MHAVVEKEGYQITLYPAAYKGRPVITIMAPEGKRTSDFYLSGYVWRCLQTKKRAPKLIELQLKDLFKELSAQ